jgi:hypothetical protein
MSSSPKALWSSIYYTGDYLITIFLEMKSLVLIGFFLKKKLHRQLVYVYFHIDNTLLQPQAGNALSFWDPHLMIYQNLQTCFALLFFFLKKKTRRKTSRWEHSQLFDFV